IAGFCAPANCTDGVRNGIETDVDCGGLCPPCADGLNCLFGFDCESGLCDQMTCSAPTCNDGTRNGAETDVDCGGGTCPMCMIGDACAVDNDCVGMICDGGVNGPVCAICEENDDRVTGTTCGYQGRGRVEQTCVNGSWVG